MESLHYLLMKSHAMLSRRILAQAGRNAELSHSALERGRGPGRERGYVDGGGRGADTFSHRPVLVEKLVENTYASARHRPYIDQTYQFGRLYRQCSRLLGYQYVFSQKSGIVYPVIHALSVELDIGRSLYLLIPESVERRETGILETGDIHPLIQFQGSDYGLAHHDIPFVERQLQEKVVI